MIKLEGKYNSAKVFTDNIDQATKDQIVELLNQDFTQDCKIRIMSDCHAGKGCVIGFTANLGGKIVPNLIGVDLGCGVIVVELGKVDIDLEQLDKIINENIPSGFSVHDGRVARFPKLRELYCYRELRDTKRIERSIGTLGGGNHFLELNVNSNGEKYLVIHSGGRNLGHQVASYYQNIAIELRSGRENYYKEREQLIKQYKEQGKRKEIAKALRKLEKQHIANEPAYPRDLCYLDGEWRDKYLHDMKICQEYANLNRETMAGIILKKLFGKSCDFDYFHTVHNYINFNDNIIRKGAISAYEGERVIIPINMRDGSILAVGKGNPDWNYSAPHGAGRIMSRKQARERLSMDEFTETMSNVYSTSVLESTLDEAPMAYKPIDEIIGNIGDTVEIIDIIKPIYNFKAKGKES